MVIDNGVAVYMALENLKQKQSGEQTNNLQNLIQSNKISL